MKLLKSNKETQLYKALVLIVGIILTIYVLLQIISCQYTVNELGIITVCTIFAIVSVLLPITIGNMYSTLESISFMILLYCIQAPYVAIFVAGLAVLISRTRQCAIEKFIDPLLPIYKQSAMMISAYIAYEVVRILGGVYFKGSSGASISGSIAVLILANYFYVYTEMIEIYLVRKKWMVSFLKASMAILNALTIAIVPSVFVMILLRYMGLAGLITFFLVLSIALYILKLYSEEKKLNSLYKGTIEALSKAMTIGNVDEKCLEFMKDLSAITEGSECLFYLLKPDEEGMIYPVIGYRTYFKKTTVLDYSKFGINLNKNDKFLNDLGVNTGAVYLVDTIKNSALEDIGEGVFLDKGAAATPIVGINGVVGMLVLTGDKMFSRKGMIESITSIAGKQLSTILVNNELYKKVEENANRDGLTGLYNRRLLDSVMKYYISEGKVFSLVLFDIDKFKEVNDANGHVFGDRVLKRVATIIKQETKGIDYACRYGGEEICVLFNNQGKEIAYKTSERIRAKIEAMTITDEELGGIQITISGGVASFPEDGWTAEEIINSADRVLYGECKRKGGNKVAKTSDLKGTV
jgi:diguanylate cyclase (GGDEF)-like protein